MLLNGVNHVAWLTKDSTRLGDFYTEVFEAVVSPTRDHGPGEKMTVIDIGPSTSLNIFEIEDNTEADRQTPMFGRGRIDHVGLEAASKEAFREDPCRARQNRRERRHRHRLRRGAQHLLPRP